MNPSGPSTQAKALATLLKAGGVAVIPTDTIYGIVTSALDARAVDALYQIKLRNPAKPYIILIDEVGRLQDFGIVVTPELTQMLTDYWPGPVSVILPCSNPTLAYLHRGTNALAFRLPGSEPLRRLLRETGPLVAPSANPEGKTPAKTIQEAEAYFGSQVSQYVEGDTNDRPSKIIRIANGEIEIVRE